MSDDSIKMQERLVESNLKLEQSIRISNYLQLYAITKDPKYLEIANELIELGYEEKDTATERIRKLFK